MDTSPPTPNPMTWATNPDNVSATSIIMYATEASDISPPIKYYFDFVSSPTGGTGGTDGDWQIDTSYTDDGLQTNHQYGYSVKAKDSLDNEGGLSDTINAFTTIETPTGVSFGEITSSSIQLKSSNTPSGLDRGNSGLKYENVTTSFTSDWKQNNEYFLDCGTGQADSFPFISRTSKNVHCAQGIATDGSCFYTTAGTGAAMHDSIFKWDKDWGFLASEYVADDSPLDKEQINSIHYHDGKLYIGANTYGGGGDSSWIVVYNASDLSYDTFHVILPGAYNGEGCAFHDNAWWCIFGALDSCAKYNIDWEHVANYALEYGNDQAKGVEWGELKRIGGKFYLYYSRSKSLEEVSGAYAYDPYSKANVPGYQGIMWIGDFAYMTIHLGLVHQGVDCYQWNGTGFDTIARLPNPTDRCTQGLGLDPDSEYVWFAERNYQDEDDHRGVKTSISWASGAELNINTQYTYKIQARNGDADTTAWCDTVKKYTAAVIPDAPTASDSTKFTIKIDVAPGDNPAATEFAIRDSVRRVWIKADGSSQATAVWQTDAQWDTTRVTGLHSNTTYNFYVRGRNGDDLETAFGLVGSGITEKNRRVVVVD